MQCKILSLPFPRNQDSWLAMSGLGNWAHTGQAGQQKKPSHCPRSLPLYLTLISRSEVQYKRGRMSRGRIDEVSVKKALAHNAFDIPRKASSDDTRMQLWSPSSAEFPGSLSCLNNYVTTVSCTWATEEPVGNGPFHLHFTK